MHPQTPASTCAPCAAARSVSLSPVGLDAARVAVAVGAGAGWPWPVLALLALAYLGRRRRAGP